MNIEGRWALVTGAAGGLGAAMARELASRGALLVLTDVDEVGLGRVVDDLRGRGHAVQSTVLDVRDQGAWEVLADELDAAGKTPALLVNNAGIAALGPALELSDESWQAVIDIDLWGVIHGCRTFVPRMRAKGDGRGVINVASASAYVGLPMAAPYFIAKAGVLRLTQSLQAEINPSVVSFTTLCPGQVETGIGATGKRLGVDSPEAMDRLVDWLAPSGRTTEHVAKRAIAGALGGRATVNVYREAWLLDTLSRVVPHQALAWFNRRHFLWRFPEFA